MPDQITSPSNPRVKMIRKLRDRKERQQTGLFYIEGVRIVAEAIQTGADFEYLVLAPDLLTSTFALDLIVNGQGAAIPRIEVSAETFTGLALKDSPQGVGAVVRQRWSELDDVPQQVDRCWVALDEVADPGNLGTILRTSDSAGWAGVILLDHSTDPFDPTAVRASMGAVFTQKIIKTDLESFSRFKNESGLPVIGAAGAASDDYHRILYPQPCILLMGSERQGLNARHLSICDRTVRIPMLGRSDSLNLSIATALIMYEIFNQKRDGLKG
jgi:TrmH family RNA methyltransferase